MLLCNTIIAIICLIYTFTILVLRTENNSDLIECTSSSENNYKKNDYVYWSVSYIISLVIKNVFLLIYFLHENDNCNVGLPLVSCICIMQSFFFFRYLVSPNSFIYSCKLKLIIFNALNSIPCIIFLLALLLLFCYYLLKIFKCNCLCTFPYNLTFSLKINSRIESIESGKEPPAIPASGVFEQV